MKTNSTSGGHKAQFNDWVKAKNITVYDNLCEVADSCEGITKGTRVSFTNEFGIIFTGLEILGFCHPFYGRCIYLDFDCYWFPVSVESLTIEA